MKNKGQLKRFYIRLFGKHNVNNGNLKTTDCEYAFRSLPQLVAFFIELGRWQLFISMGKTFKTATENAWHKLNVALMVHVAPSPNALSTFCPCVCVCVNSSDSVYILYFCGW